MVSLSLLCNNKIFIDIFSYEISLLHSIKFEFIKKEK